MLDVILDPNYENCCLKKELFMIFRFFFNFWQRQKFGYWPAAGECSYGPQKYLWSFYITKDSFCEILAGSGRGIIFCLNLKYQSKNEQKWSILHFFLVGF